MNRFSAPLAFVAAAKIRADEAEKKAPEMETLPELGLPPMDLGMPAGNAFSTGMLVRDILSGTVGVVVDAPAGIRDLVFVRCEADNLTYPIRPDQLEAMPMEAVAPPAMVPMPEAAPEPAAEPAADAAPALDEKPADEAGAKPKASLKDEKRELMSSKAIVSDPGATPLTYEDILRMAKAPITASKLIAAFGYVPKSWDKLLAALQASGAIILRSNKTPDVRAMYRKGMNTREIVLEACSQAGPVRASVLRRIGAIRGAQAIATRIKAAKAENKAKIEASRSKGVADRRPPFVRADKPTKPKPTNPPGPGMSWAWDDTMKDWFLMTLKAARKSGRSKDVSARAEELYNILLADDHKLFKEARKQFPKSNDWPNDGGQTNDAVFWLVDQVNADDELDANESLYEALFEMIFDGLT